MSKPEPPPQNKGEVVTEALIFWIDNLHSIPIDEKEATKKLINERDVFGFEKYGQHLMSKDGRNSIEDARQELGDLLQYCFKAKMNEESLENIKIIIPILLELLK